MTTFVLCTWASVLIFLVLVRVKFIWTRPNYVRLSWFAIMGMAAGFPALLINSFLSRETEFWVASGNPLLSFGGFFVGAGMGEEFVKLSAGVLVLMLVGRRATDVGRLLGMITVGLAFAAMENIVAYSNLDFWSLMARGVITVPLHACLGAIHGVAINSAWHTRRATPIVIGYFAAVVIHTFADTWYLMMPGVPAKWILSPFLAVLVAWSCRAWYRTPEVDDSMVIEPHKSVS